MEFYTLDQLSVTGVSLGSIQSLAVHNEPGSHGVMEVTAQGNMVTFSGAGANISVKGGTGSVTLGSGGDFCVTAAESISIYAGSRVSVSGNEITAAADEKLGLSADPGASIELKPGQADVKAGKIYQN